MYISRILEGISRFVIMTVMAVIANSCISTTEESTVIAPEEITELKVGDNLPSFQAQMVIPDTADWRYMRNASHQAGNYRYEAKAGLRAVIVFFHTECEDCQKEFPVLQNLYNIIKENASYEFVCIARSQTKEEIDAYWKKESLTLPYSPQTTRSIYNLFAAAGIPRIYITDTKGKISHIFTDKDYPSVEQLKEALI